MKTNLELGKKIRQFAGAAAFAGVLAGGAAQESADAGYIVASATSTVSRVRGSSLSIGTPFSTAFNQTGEIYPITQTQDEWLGYVEGVCAANAPGWSDTWTDFTIGIQNDVNYLGQVYDTISIISYATSSDSQVFANGPRLYIWGPSTWFSSASLDDLPLINQVTQWSSSLSPNGFYATAAAYTENGGFGGDIETLNISNVPEPKSSALLLAGFGAGAAGLLSRRAKRNTFPAPESPVR